MRYYRNPSVSTTVISCARPDDLDSINFMPRVRTHASPGRIAASRRQTAKVSYDIGCHIHRRSPTSGICYSAARDVCNAIPATEKYERTEAQATRRRYFFALFLPLSTALSPFFFPFHWWACSVDVAVCVHNDDGIVPARLGSARRDARRKSPYIMSRSLAHSCAQLQPAGWLASSFKVNECFC